MQVDVEDLAAVVQLLEYAATWQMMLGLPVEASLADMQTALAKLILWQPAELTDAWRYLA